MLTANLCVAHQHCILGGFHVSIITFTAQAPHNSNIPRRSKVQPQFLQRLFKELIHLSFFHAWLTVSPLPLWLSKSIYLYHRRCAQRSWKCSVRQNNNLAHRGAADTKLISVLSQVVCVQGQLDSSLTKDMVSDLNGCVLKLQLITHWIKASFFKVVTFARLANTLPDVALTECLCKKSRDWAKAFLLQWVESSSLHSKHLSQWQPQDSSAILISAVKYYVSGVHV